ncbi:hypothetical protein AMS68_004207 [Peltaster fructicola]|uniref:Xylanolytic transcriptional activator regulatory domain-containing protein n=1 Tax=Peltaster fructicola TaxID=286661 RepID=A0A6H0XW61_9PEZI|nr:hypothetical protein AMS68_004207 [Peltaster fructicola]
MSSSFKLVGFAIRLAQESGFHRESRASDSQEVSSLKRRIWWTLFARERFMAICQGLPCLIDQEYCDIDRPTLQDFPSYRTLQTQIFLQSITLAEIVAHTNKQLIISRRAGNVLPSAAITTKLVAWLTSLPAGLQLSISAAYTGTFDRDVHLLHLPYLNAITLIYLYTSNDQLPQASVAAVLAAGCTTRILKDLLYSERAIMLPEETGWYAATAALALAHVRALDILAAHVTEDIATLQTFLGRSAQTWHGSSVLQAGVNRALAKVPRPHIDTTQDTLTPVPNTLQDLCAGDGVAWPAFFPFATMHTSRLVETILVECQSTFPQLWLSTVPGGFDVFLDGLEMAAQS